MRTIINIADSQIKILDKISKKKISRDKIIGQALTSYIASNDHNNKAFENAFGLWKDKNLDSVEYQAKLCNEWNE
ncbi:MAG: hypothetical protein AB8U78_00385 [Rickettsia slovaca]|uniref:CopG family transcriptional regulator n=2 Tax=Rickettsia slovaca TaxID=35794 RepID=H8LN74_RICSL|nr:hypothetical protein [Rickettsia slovaca]AEV91949.1 hypothetical protein Rsl_349 [Rickettsia slovaca 13-B]AFD19309.1 hypothetical protein MC3_01690 [Rickettsia slovaca str. D-CWPP]